LTLKGETLRKMFKYGAVQQNMGFTGAKMTVKGEDVQEILIKGNPLDDSKTYTLATSDYLANGGDQMDFFKEVTKREATSLKIRDLMIEHIVNLTKQGKTIKPDSDSRIIEKIEK
jgi:2',3'-cyclic-nucleotide 2'-phosphodiesterase (5'-nucleotidase family)